MKLTKQMKAGVKLNAKAQEKADMIKLIVSEFKSQRKKNPLRNKTDIADEIAAKYGTTRNSVYLYSRELK